METRSQYFGSVRFFKHVILLTLALLILIPTTLCIVLGIVNHRYRTQLASVEVTLQRQSRKTDFSVSNEGVGLSVGAPQPAVPTAPPGPVTERPAYQELYPELYAKPAERSTVNTEHMVYLTFDDGPSERTPEVLKILEQYDVKATFFTIGKADEQSRAWMRDIEAGGHTLAVHTYSHNYQEVYASVENYLEDFVKQYELIYQVTGTYPQMFRFPGGSVNGYNATVYQKIIAEMVRRGFVFFDWNVSSGDAASHVTAKTVQTGATASIANLRRSIVLMHDSAHQKPTVAALPFIIETYQAAGFTFDRLTSEVVPVVFNDWE